MKIVLILIVYLFLTGCKNINEKKVIRRDYNEIESYSLKEKKNEPSVGFYQDSLMINEVKIFKTPIEEIIRELNLKKKVVEMNNYYINSGFEIQIEENEILYFKVENSNYKLKSPNLYVGMTATTLKMLYPNAYDRLSPDKLNETQLLSFELFDKQDNKIRVYLLDNKISNIVYLINETL